MTAKGPLFHSWLAKYACCGHMVALFSGKQMFDILCQFLAAVVQCSTSVSLWKSFAKACHLLNGTICVCLGHECVKGRGGCPCTQLRTSAQRSKGVCPVSFSRAATELGSNVSSECPSWDTCILYRSAGYKSHLCFVLVCTLRGSR